MPIRTMNPNLILILALFLSACGGEPSSTESATSNEGNQTNEMETIEQVQPEPDSSTDEDSVNTSPTDSSEETTQVELPDQPAPVDQEPRLNLPPANTLSLSFSDARQFNFSWRPMRGLTHYVLWERLSNEEDFKVLSDNISPLFIDLDLELPLTTRVNAAYKLQACTQDGCTDSNTVTVNSVDADLNSAVGILDSDTNENFDRFGRAISISGNGLVIAVGSPFDDVLPPRPGFVGDDSGTVTIYEKDEPNNRWQEVAHFESPGGPFSYFGRSLQLDDDGNTLAVGANGVNSVYVYEKRADTWLHWASVQPPNPESGDNFGYSVAINDQGNRMIVGAHGEDSSASGAHNNDLEDSGAAYIFSRSPQGFSWREVGHLKASNADAGDQFGWSVDMNGDQGNSVIVGAPREDSNSLGQYSDSEKDPGNNEVLNSGAAYIYSLVVTDRVRWIEQSYLKASFPRISNHFGYSVAMADFGSVVAIGAPGSSKRTREGNTQAGLVYTYDFVNSLTTKWAFDELITPRFHEDGDLFGHSLSFSKDGETLAVGAPGESGFATGLHYYSEITDEDGTGTNNSGAAYLFEPGTFLGQPAWVQSVYVRQPGISQGNDSFGFSIAIDNEAETLTVGQPGLQFEGYGKKKGAVFIY